MPSRWDEFLAALPAGGYGAARRRQRRSARCAGWSPVSSRIPPRTCWTGSSSLRRDCPSCGRSRHEGAGGRAYCPAAGRCRGCAPSASAWSRTSTPSRTTWLQPAGAHGLTLVEVPAQRPLRRARTGVLPAAGIGQRPGVPPAGRDEPAPDAGCALGPPGARTAGGPDSARSRCGPRFSAPTAGCVPRGSGRDGRDHPGPRRRAFQPAAAAQEASGRQRTPGGNRLVAHGRVGAAVRPPPAEHQGRHPRCAGPGHGQTADPRAEQRGVLRGGAAGTAGPPADQRLAGPQPAGHGPAAAPGEPGRRQQPGS